METIESYARNIFAKLNINEQNMEIKEEASSNFHNHRHINVEKLQTQNTIC